MQKQVILVLVLASIAVSGSPRASAQQAVAGSTDLPTFARPQAITHRYLPLASLQQDVLEGKVGARKLRVVRIPRPDLRKSLKVAGQGVETLVVQSRAYEDGKLASITVEYFAQADDDAVYCLGKGVDEYVNGQITGHVGAWLLAAEARTPKMVMPVKPRVGEKLPSGDVPKTAAGEDEVVSVSEPVTAPAGTFANCLKIKTVLADGKVRDRYYAAGVGCVKEAWDGGELLLTSSATLVAAKARAAAQAAGKRVDDPLARVALGRVGADPLAEQYWIGAINNPRLSAHERQDLIEDLIEDGLSDPRHPSQRDLPLILSRIRLIESLAPLAMDQVNFNAFREAHKDLMNMVRSLTGQPGPR